MKFLKTVREIKSRKGKLHFKRFAIFESKLFSIYIHTFYEADSDPYEHDHPWDFHLILLSGGYMEKANDEYYSRRPFLYKKCKAEYRHKIMKLYSNKSVSLALTGKRKREWGYYTENGWISNSDYRKSKNK